VRPGGCGGRFVAFSTPLTIRPSGPLRRVCGRLQLIRGSGRLAQALGTVMTLSFVRCSGAVLAVLLAISALGAPQIESSSNSPRPETTYVKVTFKVFVTEAGDPKDIEFVGIEPSVGASEQAALKESASEALKTWTFTPNKQNGKPVAEWVVVPVIIDLADPIPVVGT